MRLPNLNALRAFEASGRLGSFKAAAGELNVTQGAVAQQVRKLEKEVGLILFKREPRGLKLTTQGAKYHAVVVHAFRDLELGTRALAPHAVALRITVPTTLASRWLLPRLRTFRNAIPGRAIALDVGGKTTSVLEGDTDVLIHYGAPPRVVSGETVTKMAAEDLVAVSSTLKSLELGAVTGLNDLLGETLLDDSHLRWHGALGRPVPVMELGQSSLALEAAEVGEGIALVPRLLATDAIAVRRLKVLWESPVQTNRGYFVITRSDETEALSPLVAMLTHKPHSFRISRTSKGTTSNAR